MSAATVDDHRRFWPKVHRAGGVHDCWIWKGSKSNETRYGGFNASFGRIGAHRFAFLVEHGSIPEGYEIDHLCRVPDCVNPAHLEAVTPEENERRMLRANGWGPYSDSCTKGHPYAAGNEYIAPKTGKRGCRSCRREANRRSKLKREVAA